MRPAATGSSSASRACRAAVSGSASRVGPHLGVAARHLEVVDHGLQVEPRAADEERPPPPRRDVVHRPPGLGREPGHRELVPGVGDVDQVVRHLGPLGRRRLGRPDVHAAVDLHRVDRHDLDRRVAPGQGEGEGRLARRRGPDEGHGPGGGGAGRGHRRRTVPAPAPAAPFGPRRPRPTLGVTAGTAGPPNRRRG